MAVALREHPFYALHNIHSVLTDVIQAPNEGRDVRWLLGAFRCCVDCGCLLLRKAKRHIDPHTLLHGILCRSKPLSRAWIFDVRIGNPREHSCPWLNISCAVVFSSEKTSIDTPASPTNGEIVCTIFLYSSISSLFESLCPDAISSLM